MVKRFCCIFLCVIMSILSHPLQINATDADPFSNDQAKSVCLMEAESGTVLYEKNADMALPPASVTKIMTVLLVLEALDSGSIDINDQITVSDYASSMGGSQP